MDIGVSESYKNGQKAVVLLGSRQGRNEVLIMEKLTTKSHLLHLQNLHHCFLHQMILLHLMKMMMD